MFWTRREKKNLVEPHDEEIEIQLGAALDHRDYDDGRF